MPALINSIAFVFLFSSLVGVIPIDRTHAIYVSVLEIEQKKSANGTIKVKLFADDLEDALYNFKNERVDLLGQDCKQFSDLITEYLKAHLALTIKGEKLEYTYANCELNDISIWLTYSFKNETAWTEILVSADYLMELFPTQSNVVSVTKGTEKRMIRLQKSSTEQLITFN
jgi:hypothetical protein